MMHWCIAWLVFWFGLCLLIGGCSFPQCSQCDSACSNATTADRSDPYRGLKCVQCIQDVCQ